MLITYYNPLRMQHINTQLRHLLKCTFVDRIVVSNHNSAVRIEDHASIEDPRVLLMNQTSNKACGFRWEVASKLGSERIIVLDDDLLLFSSQIASLAEHLLAEPDTPHGLAGMLVTSDHHWTYHQRAELTVDYLCEAYAVTGHHVQIYQNLVRNLEGGQAMLDLVERTGDFIVISGAGSAKPRIHDVGRLLRCTTYDQVGVAVHKTPAFVANMGIVRAALRAAER